MADTTDQARNHSTDPVADLTSVPETGRTTDGSSVADAPHEHAADGRDGGYRGPQVCKIVGITYRQLDYWARTDLVRPSVCDANGSGTQRLYSYRDLVELKVVKRLLDAGISLQSARKAIEYLRTQLGADLASAHLVIDGGNTVLAQTDDQIVDLLRAGQGVLNVVALGPVVDDLEAELHRVSPTGVEESVAAHPSSTAVR
jgi:DNA-binding transcriptional MerR regulator